MRQDEKRTNRNKRLKSKYKKTLRSFFGLQAKKSKLSVKEVSKVYSAIDKAAKKRLIHKNKAARLKRRAAKLLK